MCFSIILANVGKLVKLFLCKFGFEFKLGSNLGLQGKFECFSYPYCHFISHSFGIKFHVHKMSPFESLFNKDLFCSISCFLLSTLSSFLFFNLLEFLHELVTRNCFSLGNFGSFGSLWPSWLLLLNYLGWTFGT